MNTVAAVALAVGVGAAAIFGAMALSSSNSSNTPVDDFRNAINRKVTDYQEHGERYFYVAYEKGEKYPWMYSASTQKMEDTVREAFRWLEGEDGEGVSGKVEIWDAKNRKALDSFFFNQRTKLVESA
jgi:hypothetical protein